MKRTKPGPPARGPLRLRHSLRALILDERGDVLLVRFWWPGFSDPRGFWANPGGGVEPGESRLEALQRELREEVGLEIDGLGPELWTKTALFSMTGPEGEKWDGQVDHIHLCRTPRFDPAPMLSSAQLRDEGLQELRWWSPGELAEPGRVFAPRALPRLMAQLRRDGIPERPITIEGF